MLLDSVILVLREVLEAAALISVLLALSGLMRLRGSWLIYGLIVGMIVTFGVATELETITDALDGSGQEIANATAQFIVCGLILAIVALSARSGYNKEAAKQSELRSLMMFAVALAFAREGAEIYVFISGFATSDEYRDAVFAGSLLGAGIGVSLGILGYSALRALQPATGCLVSTALLALIGAGMSMQATVLLEQVDWLPAGKPFWDSSWLIDEQSMAGELLYAVFGYEATPGVTQLAVYCLSLTAIAFAYCLGRRADNFNNAH